jgi:transcriptional regulator with XRE-family HTH domain
MGMDALPSSRGGGYITLVRIKPRSYAYPKELKTIGDHIRKRRLDLGFDQKTIGQRIGVCCLTITGWEKRHTKPKVRHLPAIITFLGYDPRPEPMSLPERIAWFREGKGWSQEQMAEFLGVDEATISSWERKEHAPTRNSVEKIEMALRKSRYPCRNTGAIPQARRAECHTVKISIERLSGWYS